MKLMIYTTTVLLLITRVVPVEARDLTRSDILHHTAGSAAVTVITLTEAGLINSEQAERNDLPYWVYGTIAAQHVPLYRVDKNLAVRFTLAESGFLIAQRASIGHPTFNDIAMNYYLKTSFYSTYALYSSLRKTAAPGEYQREWKAYSATDLALAPFKWKNLRQKQFWRPFLLISAVTWLTTDLENPVWKSSRSQIDGREFSTHTASAINVGSNMILMMATAVGEEALFRGVIYQELKESLGQRKARIADAILFPAIHLPQEVAAGMEGGDILVNFIFRSALTLILDSSYDAGGLPLSTTLHFWNNTLSRTLRWAGESSVPETNLAVGQPRGQTPMIKFTISF